MYVCMCIHTCEACVCELIDDCIAVRVCMSIELPVLALVKV
jgi:hypothetical protein